MARVSRPVDGTGAPSAQAAALEDLAGAANYRRWLADLALPYLGDDPLEVGSGLGDYAAEWAADGVRLTVSEADPDRLAHLERRFAGDEQVAVRALALPGGETGQHSAVVAYNVIEHIAEDTAALRDLARLLRPGGKVVLVVPAFPSAAGRFDRLIGHRRRYTLASLARTLSAAGLRIDELRYVNPVGLLGWYVAVRALGMAPHSGPLLSVWDRGFVPVLRRLEAGRRPPFGQSVFAVASTTEAAAAP